MRLAPLISGNDRRALQSARPCVSGINGAPLGFNPVQVSALPSILPVALSYRARASSLARLDDHSARLAPCSRFSKVGCARSVARYGIFGAPCLSGIGRAFEFSKGAPCAFGRLAWSRANP